MISALLDCHSELVEEKHPGNTEMRPKIKEENSDFPVTFFSAHRSTSKQID